LWRSQDDPALIVGKHGTSPFFRRLHLSSAY
jgi:hypothetical protein